MRGHGKDETDPDYARQRKSLETLVAQPSAAAGHVRRARVILMAADGVAGVEIARRLSLTAPQVSRIRDVSSRARWRGLRIDRGPGEGTTFRSRWCARWSRR